ncbi:trimethylamine-N-oxide reductase cytochrome c-type subunit TorC [Rhodobium orientis]|uniref:Uncharacterized protein n=1 Tax=Rhodobium orientis TaxID=34017 RepID=A0A327JXT4_9HYPH|nr:hypothetical protein [Rhodobium orientis]MBB4302732.1 trimethylamine-N-oxide reductase cytochrome c-type subunit TorC [Rhodobium orientis]MBK5948513.1 hypothetical protein [Rhodobium orientis]RAI29782.1 hypothetical protein CH339_01835 [Rhodobium orientis]
MGAHPLRLPSLFLVIAALTICLAVPGRAESPAGETVYAARTLGLHAEAGGAGKPVGRIFIATPLTVLDRSSGWLKVEVKGWHQEGAERLLYDLPGKRIRSALLAKSAVASLRPLETAVDPDSGLTWYGAAFAGWVEEDGVTDDREPLWERAWHTFSTKCVACHQRRIPHHYTANQWVSFLKIMGERAALDDEEHQLLLNFLQHHASDTGGETGKE